MKRKTKSKIPVVVIFAPTASGKTALTRELFSQEGSHFILNAEIISSDSQAVYRGMDIGTAKPDSQLLNLIPHHLIDIKNPDEQFNVSDFIDEADKACIDIFSRGKLPVVCGGTGYYIRSFLYGIPKTPVSDEKLREELKARIIKEGNEALYEELQKIDPASAAAIHKNDSYRICRALEVFYLSGKTRTSYKIEPKLREEYEFLFIVLQPEREVLYERINSRVEAMLEQGLKSEIENLQKNGYSKDSPGFKAIGYSEWFETDDEEKIIYLIKQHSRKYAKKQFTYIKDIPGSIVIDYKGTENDILLVKNYIEDFCNRCFSVSSIDSI